MRALYDAHAHLGTLKELRARSEQNIPTLLCATRPEEAEQALGAHEEYPLLTPTFGLHPWHADRYAPDCMLKYLEAGGLLGEIGMDSVWCEVPLALQRRAFIHQLNWAEERRRPVILHTKGQELEILRILRDYTMPVLVHWYSHGEYLDDYLARNCYFTVGPDVRHNEAVQAVGRSVPLNRLLIETDGLSAVQWATGEDLPASALRDVLKGTLNWLCEARGLSLDAVRAIVEVNYDHLLTMQNSV